MRVFLWIFFFFQLLFKRGLLYTSLYLWCSAFPWKQGILWLLGLSGWLLAKAVCTGLRMHSVSESSPSAVQGWFVEDFAGTKQQILKAVMALWLVLPSSLTSAWLPMPAAWAHPPQESGSSTVICAARGQGSDCSEKLDFFQLQPLASMVYALHQPVELAVTVDGYPWAL